MEEAQRGADEIRKQISRLVTNGSVELGRATLAHVPPLIVTLKQVERTFAHSALAVESHMLACKRTLDDRAAAEQELLGSRAQHEHELSQCAAAARVPALDDDELVTIPAHDATGPKPDEKQLRLRRRAAELRTRRELHARIRELHSEVAQARERRQRLMDADERAKPDLEKLVGAAAGLSAYLSFPPSLAPEPPEPQAHLLPRPLWFLHAQALLLLGSRASLYSVAITPSLAPAAAASCPMAAPCPLAVRLEVLCERSRLVLCFAFFPKLGLLAVSAPEGGAEMLATVDPTDDGLTFPHGRALLAASRGGIRMDARDLLPAVPYRWAQWLGGIEPDSPGSWPSACSAEGARPQGRLLSSCTAGLSLADILQTLTPASS